MGLNLGRVLGGAVAGLGQGLIERAKANHAAAMETARQQFEMLKLERADQLAGNREAAADARHVEGEKTLIGVRGEEERRNYGAKAVYDAEDDKRKHGYKIEETRIQYDLSDRNDSRSNARQASKEAAGDYRRDKLARSGEKKADTEKGDKAAWERAVETSTITVPGDDLSGTKEGKKTDWSAVARKLYIAGKPDLARQADITESQRIEALGQAKKDARANKRPQPAAKDPPKPSSYPDAQWSPKAGGWVVQRDGKWFKVEN